MTMPAPRLHGGDPGSQQDDESDDREEFLAAAIARGTRRWREALALMGDEELRGTGEAIIGVPFPPGCTATGYHATLMEMLLEELQRRAVLAAGGVRT